MKESSIFGQPVTVGVLCVPQDYEHRSFVSQFVSQHYADPDTQYFSNFLAENGNFVCTRQLVPGADYLVQFIPTYQIVKPEIVYPYLLERNGLMVGVGGMFMLKTVFPEAFPKDKTVVVLDNFYMLPTDKSGNRRLGTIRRFWHPIEERMMWQYGTTFWDASLPAESHILLVTNYS